MRPPWEHVPCMTCKNNLGGAKCLAYPELIPHEIFSGKIKHSSIRKDQKGKYIYKKQKNI